MDNKEKILIHASELFVARGIRNVTMDMIASDLSVSKRTIYELFSDKDTLVIECIRRMIINDNEELLEIIRTADNVVEALLRIIRHQKDKVESYPAIFIEDFKRYFPVIQASFYSCKSDLKKFSASYTLLERGMREGIFRKELKIEMVDNFIHEMISLIHSSTRIRSLKAADDDILNNIFIPYFRGICTPRGISLMDQFFQGTTE